MNRLLSASTLRGWFSWVLSWPLRRRTRRAGQPKTDSPAVEVARDFRMDSPDALERTRTAAEIGDPAAQNCLGSGLAAGDDVVRDNAEAGRWLREAASQGHADAQFNLGNLCYSILLRNRVTGEGSASRIEAYVWYHLAAAQGHAQAKAACEMLNLQLSDTELQEGNRRANAFQPGKPLSRKPREDARLRSPEMGSVT